MVNLKFKAMANQRSKVTLSMNVNEMVNLALKVYQTHTSLGTSSPLNIPGLDMETFNALNLEVQSINIEAEEFKKRSEQRYRERDKRLETLEIKLRQIKNVLKALNNENPKELGLWGFDVTDTVKTKTSAKQ